MLLPSVVFVFVVCHGGIAKLAKIYTKFFFTLVVPGRCCPDTMLYVVKANIGLI